MPHCPPDQLALAALGEALPETDAAHLAGCAACRSEVESLRRAVDVLAVPALAAPAPAVPPPPRVWDTIAASTGVTVTPRPPDPDSPVDAPGEGPPGPARRHRLIAARPGRRWLAVAAALLAAGGLGTAIVALTPGPEPTGTVLAHTTLNPVFDAGASGSARVRGDGTSRVLVVDLRAPMLAEGYYEVWLMEAGAQRMVPVGVLHTGETDLPLPDDLDLAAYPLVDVSIEPPDGNPAHSGRSVVRGRLPG